MSPRRPGAGPGWNSTCRRSVIAPFGLADRGATAKQRARVIIVVDSAAEPIPSGPRAESFYAEALRELSRLGLPYMVGGTYAVSAYTGISRPTKDLDVFCKAGDYPRILRHFQTLGFAVEIEDDRWLAKVRSEGEFFDLIFASSNGTVPVTEGWFAHARETTVLSTPVRLVGPTELVWSKAFIQTRSRYDGADVVNIILKQHEAIDWARLLGYMDLYWELLFAHLVNFRWIYPSERNRIPRWVMDELIDRLGQQLELPSPELKICRGRMLSLDDYEVAVRRWGFADMPGPVAGGSQQDED